MKKIFTAIFIVLVISAALLLLTGKHANAQEANLTGNWILAIDHDSNMQFHDMTITAQDEQGNLEGTGAFPHSETYSITWKLKNSHIGKDGVTLNIIYENSDYIAKMNGNLQSDGIIVGNWKDNRGLEGKWSAIRSQ